MGMLDVMLRVICGSLRLTESKTKRLRLTLGAVDFQLLGLKVGNLLDK